jgi:urease accessory protein
MRPSSALLLAAPGFRSVAAALLLGLLASAAQAHHAMGGETPVTLLQGLLSGLAHPVIGWDHLLFLLGAAALTVAARIHVGAARLLLGLFVLAGIVGTLLRARGVPLPAAGMALAATLLALAAWLIRVRLGASLAELLALIGGLAHGYAYGEAIVGAERSPLLAYLLGLALVQALMLWLAHAVWQRAAHASPQRLATVQRTLAALLTAGAAWQVLA